MRAAVYTRISRKDAVHDKVSEQAQQCRAFAKQQGYTVVEVFTDDGVSADEKGGKRKQRGAWDALLLGLAAGRFDVIVATEEERFARGPQAKAELELACTEAGAIWHTIRDGHLDPSTDGGLFTSGIRALFAAQEVRRKGARQKAANATRAAEGKPRAGFRPFGWEPDRVTLRESEAATIRRAVAAIIEGRSVRHLTKELNDAGVVTANGTPWSVFKVKRMITRERNAGLLIHDGVIQPNSIIEPAVSVEDWERACALLPQSARVSATGRKLPKREPLVYWLSGILKCSVCGSALMHKAVSGQGAYLMCNSRIERTATDDRRHPSIRESMVEDWLEMMLYVRWGAGLFDASGDHDKALADLNNKIADSARQRAEWSRLLATPGVVADPFLQQISAAMKQEAEWSAERDALLAAGGPDLRALREERPGVFENFTAWRDWFRSLEVSRRRALALSQFKLTLHPGRGVGRIEVEDA